MRSYEDDSRWWGGHTRGDGRLTLLDLVRNGTLDLRTAALLWLLVEAKSSIIVAAAPQLAGKTTLLTALIDFMPPWYERVYTRGREEDFSFLRETEPSSSYILVPELSDHTPAYLWGDKVRVVFDALARGYSVGATMHADTPDDVIDMLGGAPVHLPVGLLHHVGVVVNLRISYGARDMLRRVDRITLVAPGPALHMLGRWDSVTDTFVQTDSPETRAALDERLMTTGTEIALGERMCTLESWLKKGPISPAELQRAVAHYYRS